MRKQNYTSVQKKKRRPVQNLELRKATADYLNARYREFWVKFFKEQGHEPEKRDFAAWLEVLPTSLSRWMNGQGLPNDAQKRLLSKKLGMGIYVATGTTETPPEDGKARELLEDFYDLTEEQQEDIFNSVRAMSAENRQRRAGMTEA
jgi:hypothetical protein